MRDRLIRAGLALALVVAGAALYLAFATGRDQDEPLRRGGILRVFPEPETVVLRQDAIGVDLAFGYTASITVDQRAIPDDQLDILPGINRVSFTPGPGKEIEQLDEGRHCATVTYTQSSSSNDATAAAPGSYSWCFNAA